MTRYLILLPLFLFFNSCTSSSKEKKEIKKKFKKHDGYTIKGILEDTSVKKIYVLNSELIKIDSSPVKNQQFELKGKVNKPLTGFINQGEKNTPIILENSEYNVLLSTTDYMILGGKLNTIVANYRTQKNKLKNKIHEYYHQFSKSHITIDDYFKKIRSIKKMEKQLFIDFMIKNNESIISSALLTTSELSSKEATELKKELRDSKNQTLLNELTSFIEMKKLEEVAEKRLHRKSVPLFSAVNLQGRKTHLKQIIKGKKAFLIDFWASWCPPCREAAPSLKRIYNKYNRKGFDILSVSEDRNVAEWKNAIAIDETYDWQHVYDDFNRVSSMFKVRDLPHMVLIDENGKIINPKISLEELEEELKIIFGER